MDKGLADYFMEKSMNFILADGVPVSQEIKEKRLAVCNTCEYKVKAKIKPILPATWCCKGCGCALFTKASYYSLPRHKNTPADQILTVKELLEIKADGTFRANEYVQKIISCPHPDGDKWAYLK